MRRSFLLVASALLASLAACSPPPDTGDGGGDGGGTVPTFAAVQTIFNRSCTISTACHQHGGAGLIDLSNGNSYMSIVGVNSTEVTTMPYVTAGDPTNSFLYRKIDGSFSMIPFCMDHASTGECGVRMPMVGGATLSAADLQTVHDWIAAGAMNN